MTTRYAEAALSAAASLERAAVKGRTGTWWAPVAPMPGSATGLFWGAAGVALFLLECFHVTGERRYRDQALAGADFLRSAIDGGGPLGLYTGLAGVGHTLLETHRVTGDPRYAEAAGRCVDVLRERACPAEGGVRWPVPNPEGPAPWYPTDLVLGSAGIGLFLLHAARHLSLDAAVELAAQAGSHLVETADRVEGGLDWPMEASHPLRYPNLSHGTAGISYFLASLAMVTGEARFREAAILGSHRLQSIAWTDERIALIQHTEPPLPGPDGTPAARYELSWAHGPAGTARLWHRLHQMTGEDAWLDWLHRSARVYAEGVPDTVRGAVTDTSEACHWLVGAPREASFLMEVRGVTGGRLYRDRAIELMDRCVERARPVEGGLGWPVRVRSGALVNYPSLQGTAGIGLQLLAMDALLGGREPAVCLPDEPF